MSLRRADRPVISYDWFVVAADSTDCMYIVAQLYSVCVYLLEWPHLVVCPVLSRTTTSCATASTRLTHSLNNTRYPTSPYKPRRGYFRICKLNARTFVLL